MINHCLVALKQVPVSSGRALVRARGRRKKTRRSAKNLISRADVFRLQAGHGNGPACERVGTLGTLHSPLFGSVSPVVLSVKLRGCTARGRGSLERMLKVSRMGRMDS